jgi:putative transcription factor
MRCEICGETIENKPLRTKIDGSVMDVCEKCSKFGRIQKAPPTPKRFNKIKKNVKPNKPVEKRRFDEPTEELVEDYNIIIRNRRESAGLSREELGEKIYEKVSVITRVEAGKMIPDLKLAKKFENSLKIKLIEKIDEFNMDDFKNNLNKTPTLGDIVKIKKR